MAVSLLAGYPLFRVVHPTTGLPLAGGKVYTYERGTTTNKTAWTDAAKTVAHTNPIILDANGETVVFWDGEYKLRVDDSLNVTVRTMDDFNLQSSAADDVTDQESNLVVNGSFELDADGDNLPDSWTIVQNGTVAFDTTNVRHGSQSLKFTSTTAGGGTAESTSFMNVTAGASYICKFSYKVNFISAVIRNLVQVKWFDQVGVQVGATITVFTADESGDIAWTEKVISTVAPATATKAKIVLTGISTATLQAGDTNFDNVAFYEQTELNLKTTSAQAITSAITIGGTLGVTGNTSLSGTLGVTGATTLSSALQVNANASVTGTLAAAGTTITGNLTATGFLGIGLTAAQSNIHSHEGSSGTNYIQLTNTTTGVTSTDGALIGLDASENLLLYNQENTDIQILTNNSLRWSVGADGGLFDSAAIGGSQGAGTINTTEYNINGTKVPQLTILATPELLTSAIPTTGPAAWTTHSSATLASAGATIAIVALTASRSLSSTGNFDVIVSVRKTGSSTSATDGLMAIGNVYDSAGAAKDVRAAGQAHVLLDPSNDFDYNVNSNTGSITTFRLMLVGYYS